MPKSYSSVFDHFVGLALKELTGKIYYNNGSESHIKFRSDCNSFNK